MSVFTSLIKSPTRFRVSLLLTIAVLSSGLFLLGPSPFWSSLFLAIAVLCYLLALIVLLSSRAKSLIVPEGSCKRVAAAIALVVAPAYYLFEGTVTALVGLAWVGLILGAISVFATTQRLFADVVSLIHLREAFLEDREPKLAMPLVYLLAEPGYGVFFAYRLASKAAQSLMRYRYTPGGTILLSKIKSSVQMRSQGRFLGSLFRANRIHAFFLVSDSARNASREFRNWLISRASAVLVVRLPPNLAADLLGEDQRTGFRHLLGPGLSQAFGPTLDLQISPMGMEDEGRIDNRDDNSAVADATLHSHWAVGPQPEVDELIAQIVDRLATTAVPLVIADQSLADGQRIVARHLATHGLAPLADCYLRVRLSGSDLERLVSLVDSIECIIRLSTIALLVDCWAADHAFQSKKLDGSALTVGGWVRLLRELLRVDPQGKELSPAIHEAWRSPVSLSQEGVLKLVQDAGMEVELPAGSSVSQIGWLEWFIRFRNVARGHGAVEEKVAARLWNGLHGVFLEMSEGLRALALESRLERIDQEGNRVQFAGWFRNGTRPSSGRIKPQEDTQAKAFLRTSSGRALSLYPFVILRNEEVLTWDGVGGSQRSTGYLNHRTGKRELFSQEGRVNDWNARELWDAAGKTI